MGGDRADEGVIGDALAEAGHLADGTPLRPEFRRWRWTAPLPGGRFAFFADDAEAVERLCRERAVLDLLGPRLTRFAIPSEPVNVLGWSGIWRVLGGLGW